MKRAVLCALAVMVVLVVSAAVVIQDEPEPEVYGLDLDPAGGVFVEDPPVSYTAGRYTELPVPVKDGMWFSGWYMDGAPVGAILPGTEGDLILEAVWTDSPLGTGIHTEVSGFYMNGDIRHDVTGTMTTALIASDLGMFLSEVSVDLTIRSPSVTIPQRAEYLQWKTMAPLGEYVGNGEVDGLMCEVWESDGAETYLYQRWLPVLVIDGDMVVKVTDLYEAGTRDLFSPSVVTEYPVTVSCPDTARVGQEFTMTASGPDFSGWYLDGELFSASRTVTVRMDPLAVYEARSTRQFTVYGPDDDFGSIPSGQGWTVRGLYGTPVEFDRDSPEPGYYEMTRESSPVSEVMRFVIDDRKVKSIEWTYSGTVYRLDITVMLSDALRYTSMDDSPLVREICGDREWQERYFTVDDPLVVSVAEDLMSMSDGMSERSRAGFVLSFVQAVGYLTDSDTRGQREFWKCPAETLWDGGGDCEDLSVLYAVLMKAMGYDTMVAVFDGHAVAGVRFGSVSGHSIGVQGERFTLCETTLPGYLPGQNPDPSKFRDSEVLIAYRL